METSYSLGLHNVIFLFYLAISPTLPLSVPQGSMLVHFYFVTLYTSTLVTSNSNTIFIASDSSMCLKLWQSSAAPEPTGYLHLSVPQVLQTQVV